MHSFDRNYLIDMVLLFSLLFIVDRPLPTENDLAKIVFKCDCEHPTLQEHYDMRPKTTEVYSCLTKLCKRPMFQPFGLLWEMLSNYLNYWY
jgi:hypothetical protein